MESSRQLVVGRSDNALTWWAEPFDRYFQPCSHHEAKKLRTALGCLSDGSVLPVRGRDFDHSTTSFTDFDYGVAIKRKNRLFFIYESGDIENLSIHDLNLRDLVHFVCNRGAGKQLRLHSSAVPNCLPTAQLDPKRLVVLSHGFSPVVGPDYPVIKTLEKVARSRGWRVLVPDYRESYGWKDESRSREARVKILFQHLLCLEGPKPDTIILAGHSQGGACSALAAQRKQTVEAVGIRGIFLFGTESAVTLDRMKKRPALNGKDICIVHADVDGVISYTEASSMVLAWRLPTSCLLKLNSNTPPGSVDCWGDDIAHEFLSKPLMNGVVAAFATFLAQREGGTRAEA